MSISGEPLPTTSSQDRALLRWEEGPRVVGVVGIPTQEKDPRHPQLCGKGTDLEGGAGAAAAGVPRSLPPRPVPGSEDQHWYKGWEIGPWEESSACRRCRTLPHHGLLPFTRPLREGVPVKGSGPTSKQAGRGRDRSGRPPPKLGSCQPPQRGGTVAGRDPEESSLFERCGPSNHRCFRSGGALCSQQPYSFLPVVVGASSWYL